MALGVLVRVGSFLSQRSSGGEGPRWGSFPCRARALQLEMALGLTCEPTPTPGPHLHLQDSEEGMDFPEPEGGVPTC